MLIRQHRIQCGTLHLPHIRILHISQLNFLTPVRCTSSSRGTFVGARDFCEARKIWFVNADDTVRCAMPFHSIGNETLSCVQSTKCSFPWISTFTAHKMVRAHRTHSIRTPRHTHTRTLHAHQKLGTALGNGNSDTKQRDFRENAIKSRFARCERGTHLKWFGLSCMRRIVWTVEHEREITESTYGGEWRTLAECGRWIQLMDEWPSSSSS